MKLRIHLEYFNRTSLKRCFSDVRARREGFLREGGSAAGASSGQRLP